MCFAKELPLVWFRQIISDSSVNRLLDRGSSFQRLFHILPPLQRILEKSRLEKWKAIITKKVERSGGCQVCRGVKVAEWGIKRNRHFCLEATPLHSSETFPRVLNFDFSSFLAAKLQTLIGLIFGIRCILNTWLSMKITYNLVYYMSRYLTHFVAY